MSTAEPPPAWLSGSRDGISLAEHYCPRSGVPYTCQASQVTAHDPWPPLCGCYDRAMATVQPERPARR